MAVVILGGITSPLINMVTLEQAKDYLRVDFDTDDDFIQLCIDSATASIERYTSYAITESTQTYGVGRYPLFKYPYKVTSATGNYSICDDVLQVRSGNVSVKFGFDSVADIPHPFKVATLKLVTYYYENRDVYPVDLPNDVQLLLNQYRRILAV